MVAAPVVVAAVVVVVAVVAAVRSLVRRRPRARIWVASGRVKRRKSNRQQLRPPSNSRRPPIRIMPQQTVIRRGWHTKTPRTTKVPNSCGNQTLYILILPYYRAVRTRRRWRRRPVPYRTWPPATGSRASRSGQRCARRRGYRYWWSCCAWR
uniref:Putative secreted peptide n=1 Tax=Anopheles braziliensis TaxID=58242 RepID=A0A2M3ZMU2_9DIPT